MMNERDTRGGLMGLRCWSTGYGYGDGHVSDIFISISLHVHGNIVSVYY